MATAMAAVSVGASSTSMASLSANAASLMGRQMTSGGASTSSSRSCVLVVRCERGAQDVEQEHEQREDQERTGVQVSLKLSGTSGTTRRRSLMSGTVASALAALLIAGPAPHAEAARGGAGADVPLFGKKAGKGRGESPAVSESRPSVSAAPSAPAEVAVAAPDARQATGPSPSAAAGEGLTNIQQAGVVVAVDVAAVALATATVQGLLASPSK